ncbi:MAG TPA: SH3 domain-containing protein, partial [Thermomicrobiales bacterium]|nr:SH3 domain-containing protein [Thermomicrobiales bacterium]
PQPTGTATTTVRLNLRSAPNTTSAIIMVIPSGATVSLTGQSTNGFRSVRYGNQSGWAFEAYLTPRTTTPAPTPGPTVPFGVTNTLVGPVRGTANQALAVARSMGAQRMDQVTLYVTEMYRRAPEIGLDPALLVAQSALETNFWRSSWWINRLNPAGIGVTGDPGQNAASPNFASGTISARAQLAHMHAEVFGSRQPLPLVLQGVDPTYQQVYAAGWAGTIVTVGDLAGTWAVDPLYDVRIISRARVIFPDL